MMRDGSACGGNVSFYRLGRPATSTIAIPAAPENGACGILLPAHGHRGPWLLRVLRCKGTLREKADYSRPTSDVKLDDGYIELGAEDTKTKEAIRKLDSFLNGKDEQNPQSDECSHSAPAAEKKQGEATCC
jgi:hypothetical protein